MSNAKYNYVKIQGKIFSQDDLAMIFIDLNDFGCLYCKYLTYLLKSTEVIQIWEFDNIHMTQCAEIIGFLTVCHHHEKQRCIANSTATRPVVNRHTGSTVTVTERG